MKDFNLTGTYTDLYQLTMAQVYFAKGDAPKPAVFDYYFRKLPFQGGYVVFAGLQTLLEVLEDLRFSSEDLAYLKEAGFQGDFIAHLERFRFSGDVYAVKEGETVFNNTPLVRVEASILEAQVIETLLLNILNFQSLIATKASRMRAVAGNKVLNDFGLRRAQGVGGYHASRAALIGGFNATSNVKAGMDFGFPVSGTMAHSFIQSYDDELNAFRAFATHRPDQCVLLVDTYDTLASGLPNAITVAKEMEKRSQLLHAIRLDSGDLAYLSKRARAMLDDAGLPYVKIAVSNQLNEYVIKSLLDQGAPIDIFGVGTSLVTGAPDAALDGVYKLALAGGKPRIKLSENLQKLTLPHKKQVYRIWNENNFLGADLIALHDEPAPDQMFHPTEPARSMQVSGRKKEALLHRVMEGGTRTTGPSSIQNMAAYCLSRLERLPAEYKRFDNPHIYKVGISKNLLNLRDELRNNH